MTVPPGILQDIATWLHEQQEFEANHGKPAPVHASIRDALCELHALLKPDAIIPPGADLGNTDWISLLFRYKQARHPLTSSAMVFTDEATQDLTHLQRWMSHVTLEEHSEPFPTAVNASGTLLPPSFGRKKDARQYAAKCAVSWLLDQRRMPAAWLMDQRIVSAAPAPPVASSPQAAKQSAAQVPPTKKQKTATEPSTSSSDHTTQAPPAESTADAPLNPSPAPAPAPVPTSAPAIMPASSSSSSAFGAGEPSVLQEVNETCKKLMIQPPAYKITADEGDPDFFSGHAEFSGAGALLRLPPDVGRVEHVYGGKAYAREAIAGRVLEELRKVLDERLRMYRDIFARLGES